MRDKGDMMTVIAVAMMMTLTVTVVVITDCHAVSTDATTGDRTEVAALLGEVSCCPLLGTSDTSAALCKLERCKHPILNQV